MPWLKWDSQFFISVLYSTSSSMKHDVIAWGVTLKNSWASFGCFNILGLSQFTIPIVIHTTCIRGYTIFLVYCHHIYSIHLVVLIFIHCLLSFFSFSLYLLFIQMDRIIDSNVVRRGNIMIPISLSFCLFVCFYVCLSACVWHSHG